VTPVMMLPLPGHSMHLAKDSRVTKSGDLGLHPKQEGLEV
jgi:hypothetical protein